jgi:hypothetical protein
MRNSLQEYCFNHFQASCLIGRRAVSDYVHTSLVRFRTSVPYARLPADGLKLAVGCLSAPDVRQVALPEDGSLGENQLASNPLACFIDLILHPHSRLLPPLPPKLDVSAVNVPSSTLFKQANESEESVVFAAWKRFGPNNPVLHSFAALNAGAAGAADAAYAHGIFPLASCLFKSLLLSYGMASICGT